MSQTQALQYGMYASKVASQMLEQTPGLVVDSFRPRAEESLFKEWHLSLHLSEEKIVVIRGRVSQAEGTSIKVMLRKELEEFQKHQESWRVKVEGRRQWSAQMHGTLHGRTLSGFGNFVDDRLWATEVKRLGLGRREKLSHICILSAFISVGL